MMETQFKAHGKEYELILTYDYFGCDVISIKENGNFIAIVDIMTEPTQALMTMQARIINNKHYEELIENAC
ncbi:hypothetical protein BU104_14350 [Staphylococcus xylosus]|uniref:Uncharacterized protein n=1 Tax=Staphylococcus xylosus TaxID=1288 RepID=A0AAQ0LW34_STAXY|nr:hypothetical protein [Staphylococcus xylosus]RIM90461.1 hypothetical protein BU104_14350 [Staphylococcus xylosus]